MKLFFAFLVAYLALATHVFAQSDFQCDSGYYACEGVCAACGSSVGRQGVKYWNCNANDEIAMLSAEPPACACADTGLTYCVAAQECFDPTVQTCDAADGVIDIATDVPTTIPVTDVPTTGPASNVPATNTPLPTLQRLVPTTQGA